MYARNNSPHASHRASGLSGRILSVALLGTAFAASGVLSSAHARGGGDCENPMHFTEISQIKCDHFGTANTPWLNASAEWIGAPVACLSVDFPGQDPGYNAGCAFGAGPRAEKDGTPFDFILVSLDSGTLQPGSSTVTSSSGGCTLRFSVDVVFHDLGYPFAEEGYGDATWVYLVDDAPLVDGQRIAAGTHYFEWRMDGNAELGGMCPGQTCTQVNVSGMPALKFTQHVEPPCVGDIDGDATVGAADLSLLLSLWGDASTGIADLDGDGVTGASDLSLLLANWGDCR